MQLHFGNGCNYAQMLRENVPTFFLFDKVKRPIAKGIELMLFTQRQHNIGPT